MKGKTGENTSTIIDVSKKRKKYLKAGKAHCQKCVYLSFGYYCDKFRNTPEHVNKSRHCKFFINKSWKNKDELKAEYDLTSSQRKAIKRRKKKKEKKKNKDKIKIDK